MAFIIKHRIAIYLDSSSESFYSLNSITRQLHNLAKDIHIPFVYKKVPFNSTSKAELKDLAPLDHDLNLVLLPNRYHVIHTAIQAQCIVLQIGFGKKEKGSYCTFLQRVRYYLRGNPLDTRKKTLFSYSSPHVKPIDISMMMDIADIKMFSILRKQIQKAHISKKDKQITLQILSLKELLFKRGATLKQLQERNDSIKYCDREYSPMTLEGENNDFDMPTLQK